MVLCPSNQPSMFPRRNRQQETHSEHAAALASEGITARRRSNTTQEQCRQQKRSREVQQNDVHGAMAVCTMTERSRGGRMAAMRARFDDKISEIDGATRAEDVQSTCAGVGCREGGVCSAAKPCSCDVECTADNSCGLWCDVIMRCCDATCGLAGVQCVRTCCAALSCAPRRGE